MDGWKRYDKWKKKHFIQLSTCEWRRQIQDIGIVPQMMWQITFRCWDVRIDTQVYLWHGVIMLCHPDSDFTDFFCQQGGRQDQKKKKQKKKKSRRSRPVRGVRSVRRNYRTVGLWCCFVLWNCRYNTSTIEWRTIPLHWLDCEKNQESSTLISSGIHAFLPPYRSGAAKSYLWKYYDTGKKVWLGSLQRGAFIYLLALLLALVTYDISCTSKLGTGTLVWTNTARCRTGTNHVPVLRWSAWERHVKQKFARA